MNIQISNNGKGQVSINGKSISCSGNVVIDGNTIIIGECNENGEIRPDVIKENVQNGIRYIKVSGANGDHEIESGEPIDITISGANNDVFIKETVKVLSIRISGANNSVKYPRCENPNLNTSGANNRVSNY